MENVIIVDQISLDQKIQKMINDGKNKLHVVSDFDKTMTKAFVGGKYRSSLLAVLRDEKYLTPDYSAKAQALFDHYHPMEIDPNISIQEKKLLMMEWWTKHFELLLNSGLNKKDVQKAVQSTSIEFRDYLTNILDMLDIHQIPLIILSASGLGYDGIHRYLKSIKKLYENTYILSNTFQRDRDGNAVDIHQPIIHSFNKEESLIENSPFYGKIKNRNNIILLGDSPGDSYMAHDSDNKTIIKIGFLNDNIDQNLELFKKHFDILITGDGSMKYVYDLLRNIIK
ncbi:hypothetical protein K9M48_00030 [Candidatus Gracilibacteria bacterium]|nr:hypothetical protein [Candidatus Gracilibacteria bacterium]